MGLIRFGGHLPKGEYDVDHDGHEGQADAADAFIRLTTRRGRYDWSSMRARRSRPRRAILGLMESSLSNWVEQAREDRTKGKTGLTTVGA